MSAPTAARLLIVEPDESVRNALVAALLRAPTRHVATVEATTSEDARTALGHDRYDMVLAAAQLGKVSGAELLATVARSHPKATRVLVASHGEAPTGAPVMARSLVQTILWKPIVETEAMRLFEGLLARASQDAAIASGAPSTGRRRPAAALRAELRRIDTEMRRLRVQLALGAVSSAAYTRLWDELAQRRAKVEDEERRTAGQTSASA